MALLTSSIAHTMGVKDVRTMKETRQKAARNEPFVAQNLLKHRLIVNHPLVEAHFIDDAGLPQRNCPVAVSFWILSAILIVVSAYNIRELT